LAQDKQLILKIKRQKDAHSAPYWEELSIPYQPNLNIIAALMEVRKQPKTTSGSDTTAPAWEMNCLENVCGSCTMVINGKVQQACTALVDKLDQPITIAPMTKFPVIKDLIVDRSRMFSNLIKIRAWVPIDGTYDLGPGPRLSEGERQKNYHYSQCMTCGCCLEVCPQVSEHTDFMGAQAIGQARLFNHHPTGTMNKEERLEAISGNDGVTTCGNAQNCVKGCDDLQVQKVLWWLTPKQARF
jgi:succinate dehydrogenase / fumarate reductase iron-sulfur subunit